VYRLMIEYEFLGSGVAACMSCSNQFPLSGSFGAALFGKLVIR
jgi:hypothetical protein